MQMVYTYKILAFKYVSNQNMFQIDAHTHALFLTQTGKYSFNMHHWCP